MAHYKMENVKRAPCLNPLLYVTSCCCFPCVAFAHRRDALGSNWPKDYKCCQNALTEIHPSLEFFPESGPAHPTLCLCLESWCVPGLSYDGSRHVISTDFHLTDRPFEAHCSKIILCSYCCCGPVACVWALWFDACLFVQQDRELRNQGKSSTMCCEGKDE